MNQSLDGPALCYRCQKPLEQNQLSREHLIPEALGGKVTSKWLICDPCNNHFGTTIDAELIKQIGHHANILKVNYSTTSKIFTGKTMDGQVWRVQSGLKGIYCVKCEIKGKQFEIKGTTKNEVLVQLKKWFKDRKRKEPDLDIEHEMSKLVFENEFAPEIVYFTNGISDDPNEIVVGGSKFYQGVAKIIVNFYLENGGNQGYISDILNVIRNNGNNKPKRIRFIYNTCIVRNYLENEISHCVKIYSSPTEEYLIGCVELFSIYRVLVILNPFYKGPDINYSYGYDLLKKEEFEPIFEFFGSKQDVLNMQFNEDNASKSMVELHDRFTKIVDNQQELL